MHQPTDDNPTQTRVVDDPVKRRREWYLVDSRGRAELVMYSGAELLHLYAQPPFGTYASVAPCPRPR